MQKKKFQKLKILTLLKENFIMMKKKNNSKSFKIIKVKELKIKKIMEKILQKNSLLHGNTGFIFNPENHLF